MSKQLMMSELLTPKKLPKLLSKSLLCVLFSVDENGNPCSSYLMKKQFDMQWIMSNDGLGMSLEKWQHTKVFNVQQTQKIYSHFQITKDDL
jgi:hypothetical protein